MVTLSNTARQALFLLVCVPFRIGLIILSYALAFWIPGYWEIEYAYGVVAILIGVGFAFFYFTKNHEGTGFFGGPRWWHSEVHALFYIVFGVAQMLSFDYAFLILVVDLLFGMITFIINYSLGLQQKLYMTPEKRMKTSPSKK